MRLDRPAIKRLLDDSEGPVRHKVFNAALLELGHAADAEAEKAVELRVRNVLNNLQRHGQVRSVRLGQEIGWVWNHRTYTDDEWRARDQAPKPEGYPMPIVHTQAPEAIVTIIENVGVWEALRPKRHTEERDLI